MRRFLLFILCMLVVSGIHAAERILRVECHHTLENFFIDYDCKDSLVFVSGGLMVSDNYPFKPGVPMLAYGVTAPYGMKITGHRVEIPDTVLVCKGWRIARNPGPVRIGRGPRPWETNKDTSPKKWMFPYEGLDSIYPAEKVKCDSGGFDFYPFSYDPATKELTFTPSLIVEMILEPLSDEEMAVYPLRKPSPDERRPDVIIHTGNRELKLRTYKLDEDYDFEDVTFENPVDYIIITHEWWEQLYEPLIKWKTQKGLRCAIKTLEDIEAEYEGATLPEKIKRYIHDMYTNHGASYILLGGDVPAVSVRLEKTGLLPKEDMVPTDLYYACFTNQFDWDANGNGILGELDDNISMVPEIIVTRLPVDYPTHVRNAVNKIIKYEKDASVRRKILMEGALMEDYVDVYRDGKIVNITDGQNMSELLYSTFIKPHWSGALSTIYDENDLSGGWIRDALEKGYGYIDVQSHGEA